MQRIKEVIQKMNLSLEQSSLLNEEQKLQKEINEYNSRTGYLKEEDGIECAKCNNKGNLAYNNEGYLYIKFCSCIGLRHSVKALAKCGVSIDMLKKYTLENYHTEHEWQVVLKKRAKEYIQENYSDTGKWLYFGGQSGSGKTHLCTGIIQELGKTFSVQYSLWNRLSDSIKFADVEEKEKRLADIGRVEVLYIDDLFKGSSKPTDADIKTLFEILNIRYLNSKSMTIISSEISLNQLGKIDEGIAGRIVERLGVRCKYGFTAPQDAKLNYRYRGVYQ